jgi:hypothetical protein
MFIVHFCVSVIPPLIAVNFHETWYTQQALAAGLLLSLYNSAGDKNIRKNGGSNVTAKNETV